MLFFVPIDRTAEAGDKTGVTQSIMRTVRRFDLSTKSGAKKSIEEIVCYLIPVPKWAIKRKKAVGKTRGFY